MKTVTTLLAQPFVSHLHRASLGTLIFDIAITTGGDQCDDNDITLDAKIVQRSVSLGKVGNRKRNSLARNPTSPPAASKMLFNVWKAVLKMSTKKLMKFRRSLYTLSNAVLNRLNMTSKTDVARSRKEAITDVIITVK
jgi:hypothetical protein